MTYFPFLSLSLFGYMVAWFILSLFLRRNDIADIAWGLGFVLLAWLSLLMTGDAQGLVVRFLESDLRSIIVTLLVTVWGLRLAWHIFLRTIKKPEDRRYRAWREEWGKRVVVRSFLQVFMLQGFFLFLIALPFLVINNQAVQPALNFLDYLGIGVWIFGFLFEAVSDWQLKQFISDKANKGKLMQSGLWKYSRHPNYFGEVVQWWGIYLIALSVSGGTLTIVSPILITWLILYVSGVPLLEKKYEGRADFEAYKKRTSIFVPLPPRS